MIKILFITAFPPNQKTAGQDYSRRLLLDLVNKSFAVDLIYADYPKHEIELPECINVLLHYKPKLLNCFSLIKYHPFFTKRFNKKVLNYIKSISNNYDVLYFDFSQMHIYSKFVEHPYKVLMCHDIIFQKYTRKGKLQLPYILSSERNILQSASRIITFSKKDCVLLQNKYNLNSVSVNFYLKSERFIYNNFKLNNCYGFYGAWNRPENVEALVWFADNVAPFLHSQQDFFIIGGSLSESVYEYIKSKGKFRYLGFVDNPLEELSKCQALIAPLKKGAGVKVKVIDALTAGCPVIGTSVAFEGIEDNKNSCLLYNCESAQDYIRLLDNWTMKSVEWRQQAADEFFHRYNNNHFSDYIVKEFQRD